MFRRRFKLFPALVAASLAFPAAAEDAHHPPADAAKPAQPAQPARPGMQGPGMQGPGGMMGGMMQMMQQMMSAMHNSGAMHRMRMMGMEGMGGMGMMARMHGAAVDRIEGHIAFLKAELKITAAQDAAWTAYAAALRANAKQLNEFAAAQPKAPATPVDRLAQREKSLGMRLEIVRRTQPALAMLYAALSDEQKKTFGELAAPRRGMGMH